MTHPSGGETWGRRKARWYSEALHYSDYADKVLAVMEPVVKRCKSLLDIGAGCGALSIPLARAFDDVLALEPSPAMLDELQENARRAGISNIQTNAAPWQESERRLGQFDVVLCANVPTILDHPEKAVPRLEAHARRFVFLVLGTDANANKFFFRELWPRICGTEYPTKKDYFVTYSALYRMGIRANIMLIRYSFDQPYRDLDEAVLFWKEHMSLSTGAWDTTLREFLSERLESWGGLLWAHVPKVSAVIWWQP